MTTQIKPSPFSENTALDLLPIRAEVRETYDAKENCIEAALFSTGLKHLNYHPYVGKIAMNIDPEASGDESDHHRQLIVDLADLTTRSLNNYPGVLKHLARMCDMADAFVREARLKQGNEEHATIWARDVELARQQLAAAKT